MTAATITFGAYQGQFAVYRDGVLIGDVYDDTMARVRAAGIPTGNRPLALCTFLGRDVLDAYEKMVETTRKSTPKSRRRGGRGSMMRGY